MKRMVYLIHEIDIHYQLKLLILVTPLTPYYPLE